jgi:indole-3-glycerol phosphate synthase
MILDDIVAAKTKELAWLKERRPFAAALRRPGGLAVIAELKQASPSKGVLRGDWDPLALAGAYASGGAAALSVLTERDHFRADPWDLRRVREAVGLPLLRKDFIFDPWQIGESLALGADAVLLIVAVLHERTAAFVDAALEAGLEPLVEVHDEAEMGVALGTRARVIGINNRDLRTFETNLGVTRRLAPRAADSGRIVVAESGIMVPDDLEGFSALGVSAVLVGESLLRSADPAEQVRRLAACS